MTPKNGFRSSRGGTPSGETRTANAAAAVRTVVFLYVGEGEYRCGGQTGGARGRRATGTNAGGLRIDPTGKVWHYGGHTPWGEGTEVPPPTPSVPLSGRGRGRGEGCLMAHHGERGTGGGASMGGKKKKQGCKTVPRHIQKEKRETRPTTPHAGGGCATATVHTPPGGRHGHAPRTSTDGGPVSCTGRARWLPTPEHAWLISAPDRAKKKKGRKKKERDDDRERGWGGGRGDRPQPPPSHARHTSQAASAPNHPAAITPHCQLQQKKPARDSVQ